MKMLEILVVKPASLLGSSVVEGYINDQSFSVTFDTDTRAIDYITLKREIVWANDHNLLEEPIRNPIDIKTFAELKKMLSTQIRTISGSRR
jgi:hypothetical protein